MPVTPHIIIGLALVVAAAAIAVPTLLALPPGRPIPTERLTVPAERTRPPLVTADRALGPLVQSQAGLPTGNPFALRERGRAAMTAVPEPPPPLLDLPDPPLTPFATDAP